MKERKIEKKKINIVNYVTKFFTLIIHTSLHIYTEVKNCIPIQGKTEVKRNVTICFARAQKIEEKYLGIQRIDRAAGDTFDSKSQSFMTTREE